MRRIQRFEILLMNGYDLTFLIRTKYMKEQAKHNPSNTVESNYETQGKTYYSGIR